MKFYLLFENIQQRSMTSMKAVFLASSIVGSKTAIATKKAVEIYKEKQPEDHVSIFDLKEYSIQFSDGRNYLDYDGDTLALTTALMEADVIYIGTPIFQSSIPGTLKNVFDLLPPNAFRDKTIGLVVTAGTDKHYLVAEYQLKPIISYMKGNLLPNYVFIQDRDFHNGEIENHEILLRLNQSMDDLIALSQTYKQMRQALEDSFDF